MYYKRAITRANVAIIVIILVIGVAGAAYYYSTTPVASPAATTGMKLKEVRLLNSIFPSASFIHFSALQAMGYLKAEGINASVRSVVGTPTAAKALISGSADIASVSTDGTVSAIATGGDLKALVEWGLYQVFVVATPKSIQTWHDIVGKRIAISGVGALAHTIWLGMLNAEHISAADVRFVNVGSNGADRLKALIAGTVDAAIAFPDDWLAVADTPRAANFYLFLPSIKEFFPFYGNVFLVARTSYIREHPDIIQGFTTAYIKMNRDFYQSKEIFFKAADTVFPGRYSDHVKEDVWNSFRQNGYFAVNGGLNSVKLTQLINYTYTVLNTKAAGNPYIHGWSDVVDTSFVKQTLDQLGVFKVNGQVASWDVPDWYSGGTRPQTSSPAAGQPGGVTTSRSPSGYIERILAE